MKRERRVLGPLTGRKGAAILVLTMENRRHLCWRFAPKPRCRAHSCRSAVNTVVGSVVGSGPADEFQVVAAVLGWGGLDSLSRPYAPPMQGACAQAVCTPKRCGSLSVDHGWHWMYRMAWADPSQHCWLQMNTLSASSRFSTSSRLSSPHTSTRNTFLP